MEKRCSVFIRKWLGLPKPLNTPAPYGKPVLQLSITSIEWGKKWKAKEAVNGDWKAKACWCSLLAWFQAILHKQIRGSGTWRNVEEERQYVDLVQCSQQGQYLWWEEYVGRQNLVERTGLGNKQEHPDQV